MKNILIITNKYYPDSTSGSNIVTVICEELSKSYNIDVYTMSSIGENDNEIINNVNIYRNNIESNSQFEVLLGRIISVSCGYFTFNIVRYKKRLRGLIHLYKQNHYDYVISFCYPITNHYLAYELKKKGIKWVAYYLDPYFNNEQSSQNRIILLLKKATEKKMLQKANALVVPSYLYSSYSKLQNHNIYKIDFPNIRTTDIEIDGANKQLDDKFLNCVFTGNLYGDIRSPDYLLGLIENISNPSIRFYFVGGIYNVEENKLGKWSAIRNVCFLNRVPKDVADEMVREADILINIGNTVTNQLPGKLFDYVSTGKPIINISKNDNCLSMLFLQNYPLHITIKEKKIFDINDVSLLEEFILKNKNKRVQKKDIRNNYKQFCTDVVIGQITRLIEDLEE